MNEMTTVSRVLTVLKERGYTSDLSLNENYLTIANSDQKFYPNEFVVDKIYRFEGPSNPDDEAIVFAIRIDKYNLKGVLVDSYGPNSTYLSREMIQALKENSPNPSTKGEEEKANLATELRPEGDRLVDAKLLSFDLKEWIQQLKSETTWQEGDRNSITLSKSAGMRVVLIALHKGAELKTHTAPGPISVQVLEGQLNFTAEGTTETLQVGNVLTLHSEIPHSVFAVEESCFLLTLAIQKA